MASRRVGSGRTQSDCPDLRHGHRCLPVLLPSGRVGDRGLARGSSGRGGASMRSRLVMGVEARTVRELLFLLSDVSYAATIASWARDRRSARQAAFGIHHFSKPEGSLPRHQCGGRAITLASQRALAALRACVFSPSRTEGISPSPWSLLGCASGRRPFSFNARQR